MCPVNGGVLLWCHKIQTLEAKYSIESSLILATMAITWKKWLQKIQPSVYLVFIDQQVWTPQELWGEKIHQAKKGRGHSESFGTCMTNICFFQTTVYNGNEDHKTVSEFDLLISIGGKNSFWRFPT